MFDFEVHRRSISSEGERDAERASIWIPMIVWNLHTERGSVSLHKAFG